MKFAHIADTHVKNLKYHKEYKAVFEQLYASLREENVDYIVHCGDIAHTKTQISPEFVDLCSDFLKNLADIAPTYIILGNHDGNLRNSQRQDAISPIVDALDHHNLFLLKNSGETHLNDDFCLNVLSVFDEDNWTQPTDKDKINIGLYHGAIKNSKTDTGYVMEHGEHDVSIFDHFDFGFLGDIHKTQLLNSRGTVAYAGSTIQQNFGEEQDKGIFIWDIKSKKDFTRTKINFVNPKPFITVKINQNGELENKNIKKGARVRLVTEANLPLEQLKKAMDVANHLFKPESLTFLNKANGKKVETKVNSDKNLFENLRDDNTQKKLIKEYLADYEVEEDALNEIYSLNSKYNKVVEESEDISRNVHWKIKKLSWDNLFNYEEGNEIDFNNLSGTVGIFGRNYSGKSSVVDSLLYTIFNNTSKNIRKTYNIINEKKDYGSGYVEIEVGDKLYKISRKANKSKKKTSGSQKNDAKTLLDFECYDYNTGETTCLNQNTRNDTDKQIRSIFGDMNDFLNTSMSSQLGAMDFINEGSTKRKEILAKFLDLEFFERKLKLAKADASDLKGALKRLDGRDYELEIKEAKDNIFMLGADLAKQKNKHAKLKEDLTSLQADILDLETKVSKAPEKVLNIGDAIENLSRKEKERESLLQEIALIKTEITTKQDFLNKSSSLLESIDILDLNSKKEDSKKIEKQINKLIHEQEKQEQSRSNSLRQIKILTDIPCGEKYLTTCKFIKDAYAAKQGISLTEKLLKELSDKVSDKNKELEALDLEHVNRTIDNWTKLSDKSKSEKNALSSLEVKLERKTVSLSKVEDHIKSLNSDIEYYRENKEVLDNLDKILLEIATAKETEAGLKMDIKDCQEEIYSLASNNGAAEQKLQNLIELKEEKEKLTAEYSAYDLFMKCMHSSGIAFEVIKKALPIVNDEIANVLMNVVDFKIYFENNENKLDIFIQHPGSNPRPLENGSGAEKTLASIAIRIALLSVSNMPSSDILVLDEPGTALDAENMEGFVRILDMVKSYFNVTLLITHIESLKDNVDKIINVVKDEEGYARLYY